MSRQPTEPTAPAPAPRQLLSQSLPQFVELKVDDPRAWSYAAGRSGREWINRRTVSFVCIEPRKGPVLYGAGAPIVVVGADIETVAEELGLPLFEGEVFHPKGSRWEALVAINTHAALSFFVTGDGRLRLVYPEGYQVAVTATPEEFLSLLEFAR